MPLSPISITCLLLALLPQVAAWSADLGLTTKDGVVMRNGLQYHGIGANYFDLFQRVLLHPEDRSSLDNLEKLSKAGIPFVRFMACGYWPDEMQLYLDNEDEYWRRMDLVIRAAENADIGVIPSMFWNFATVPDLMGERVKVLGDPRSKSVDFIRRYAWKMVRRYHGSPAIWAWEFGNEYNLIVDLPEAEKHLPAVAPKHGTPAERDRRDVLTNVEVAVAEDAFLRTVRQEDDANRLLLSGNSMPAIRVP